MLKSTALAVAKGRSSVTHSKLIKSLDYNQQSGEFHWKLSPTTSVKVGSLAGNYGSGKYKYNRISIGGKSYLAHRLAWFYVYKFWPDDEIDHKDRNPHNNAIANLREASRVENEQNSGMRSHNTSGFTGVAWDKSKKRWQAGITVNGRFKFLGRFGDKNRAIKARLAAEKRYCGEFSPNHRIGFVATALLLMLCLFVSWSPAHARNAKPALHPDCGRLWPCTAPYTSTPDQVLTARGRYVASQVGFGGPVVRRAVRAPKARQGASYRVPSQSVSYAVGQPARFIPGRLICAVNVNAALAERGIRGTGSALAMSFRRWGRSAGGPVPGAVILSARRGGGHVAIVSRVEGGIVYAWNASGRQRGWREIPYRKRVIDYRVPG